MLLGGAFVHAVVLAAAHWKTGAIDGYAFRSLDGQEFYAIAGNLAEHGAFSQSDLPPFTPDTWRTPGYPLFLGSIMLLFGKSSAALILAQQMLAIVNVVLVFRIARMHMSDSRAALAAGLFLIEPYQLYYSLWLLSTTWLVTLLLLTWLAWAKAIRGGGVLRFGILGGLCGFLVVTWPGTILIPVAVFSGIAAAAFRSWHTSPVMRRPAVVAATLLFVTACLAAPGLWMMRNLSVAGRFALSHQGGIVLSYFKATEVVLWRQGRAEDRYLETSLNADRRDEPHPVWETIDEALQGRLYDLPIEQRNELSWANLAQGNKTSVDPFRVSAELGDIGLDHLLHSPLSTLACCTARFGSILTFPLDIALWPPKCVEVHRLRSAAVGTLYLMLCLAAVVRLARGKFGFEAIYFPLACTLALLMTTTPQTDPRFRVPMMGMLIFVALLPVNRADSEGRPPDRPASTRGEPDKPAEPC